MRGEYSPNRHIGVRLCFQINLKLYKVSKYALSEKTYFITRVPRLNNVPFLFIFLKLISVLILTARSVVDGGKLISVNRFYRIVTVLLQFSSK